MHWLYAHFIGDYLLQNDWMAAKKKESSWICLIHVLLYMSLFFYCMLLNIHVSGIVLKGWQLLAIGIQHFLQDRTNFVIWFMRIKGSKKFAEPPFAPWSIILIDNILHILWIAAVIKIGEFV
jgi:hypothetical protein